MQIKSTDHIDLQLHTIHSDGKWTPDALIQHLVKEEFTLAAITDHDNLTSIPLVQAVAQKFDFWLLPAVEMTTIWQEDDLITDLLCYGIEFPAPALEALANDLLKRQQANSKLVLENLFAGGYLLPNGTPEEKSAMIENTLAKPAAEQPHVIADAFYDAHPNPSQDQLRAAFKDARPSLETNPTKAVVEAVHAANGICIIAHPGRTDGFVTFDAQILDTFREDIAIDGIEVYHPKNSPEQVTAFLDYATKHKLLITAGSDSHKPEKQLPIKYQAKQCQAFLERLGIEVI